VAVDNALVLPGVPPATQSRRVFERALVASLADPAQAASVGFTLRAMKNAAGNVRERLSQSQWQTMVQTEHDFRQRCGPLATAPARDLPGPGYSVSETLRTLEATSQMLAAITGAQTDRMMRDDGWRLLSIGRHIERLGTLASALAQGLSTGAVRDEGGFRAMLALFDSTITFQARHQQRRDLAALMDLLVLDADNPRSLAWVVQTLRSRLAKLSGVSHPGQSELAALLSEPALWPEWCQAATGGQRTLVEQALRAMAQSAWSLSEQVSRRYFSHAADHRSVGA
jgi:uncharacterized alpha-E superfamily protein